MLKRQRGVAVITALLLTTLAISIVASLFWQQQVQVRSMENQRLHLQTKWILRGALDWATLVLRQDGRDNRTMTALTHVWATPLAETRLDQYIERERVQGEVFDATLSGSMVDATSRFNLRNLADGGVANADQTAIFARLLKNLQLDPSLAALTARAVASGQPAAVGGGPGGGPGGGGGGGTGVPPAATPVSTVGSPMQLTQLEDLLAVPGYTLGMVEKLRPFAIVLPEPTKVNVNTAPAEVLGALAPSFSVAEASSMAASRKQTPFPTLDVFNTRMGGTRTLSADIADVKSEFFLVVSNIKLDRAALNAEALVNRKLDGSGQTYVVWVHQN